MLFKTQHWFNFVNFDIFICFIVSPSFARNVAKNCDKMSIKWDFVPKAAVKRWKIQILIPINKGLAGPLHFKIWSKKTRRLETLILFSLFASASTAWLWKMGGGGSREIGSLTLNLFFPMFWPCTSFPSCVHWQLPHINTVKMSHLYLILSNKNAESYKDDKSKKSKKFAAY